MTGGMQRLTSNGENEPSKSQPEIIESPTDPAPSERLRAQAEALLPEPGGGSHEEYHVFKRRWFGLVQLILLNIVVSWDVRSFSPLIALMQKSTY